MLFFKSSPLLLYVVSIFRVCQMSGLDKQSTSSSDEYEDAEDELGPLPHLISPQNGVNRVTSANGESGNNFLLSRTEHALRSPDAVQTQPSTSAHVNLTTPPSLTPQLNKVFVVFHLETSN